MSQNNNAAGSNLSPDLQPSPWWKKAWVLIVALLVLVLGSYVWWAKPAFLFKSQDATAPGAQAGGAPGGFGGQGGGGGAGGGFGGPGGGGGFGGRGGQMAPVGAARARTADVNVYIPALGSVTASNTATVRVRVDGLVLNKLHFKEGQTVKAGQLLAELDPRALLVQQAQAQGQLARDVAQLENGKVDLVRYRNLLAQDSIAKQQLDTQVALVQQQEATVKIDQANLEAVKLQLSYTKVTAPISGRIGLRQVDEGNIVRSSDVNGIAIITQVQPINVVFTIPEANIARVLRQLEGGVKMPVDAWDREQKNKIATGELVTVDNQIDATTGTIKLKAVFTNDDLTLFPNQFVNTQLLTDVRHGATVVPTAAVLRGTDSPYVYVVKDDKTVTVRQVRAGTVQGDDTMILSGIEPGEVVVIDGTDRLREGMKVEAIVRAETEVKVGTKQPRRSRNGAGGGFGGAGDPPGGFNGAAPGGAPSGPNAGNGQGQGFGGGGTNRPMNPDGTPRQRPEGQTSGQAPSGQNGGAAPGVVAGGGQAFGGGNRPANPDGTPRQFPTNPDGTPRERPTNPDGTPRQRPMNPDGTPRQFPNGGNGGGGFGGGTGGGSGGNRPANTAP